jgi:DNA-binding FrmR family transcriptional regulator
MISLEIYKLYPNLKHTPDSADILKQLIHAAKGAWNSIDNQILEKLSNTMPHQVKAVVEANGCLRSIRFESADKILWS